MKKILIAILSLFAYKGLTQSIELMPHDDGLFADVQFLKPLSADYKWTVFSRTRLNSDLDENNNLLSALYVSYTTRSGIGGTTLAAISNTSTNSGVGVHYTLNNEVISLFALPYVTFKADPDINWFSILRCMPFLNEKTNFYSSLELFSVFNDGHVFSVQRMRAGLQKGNYQFGLGLNLQEVGNDYITDEDLGVFLRLLFD